LSYAGLAIVCIRPSTAKETNRAGPVHTAPRTEVEKAEPRDPKPTDRYAPDKLKTHGKGR